jgi:Rrf2 family nitric oxide-sensitive transcriptional repressor
MFSQTVEYALRAVVHLADQAPAPRTTDQIAAATRVPKAYLSKVLQGLSHAGVVHSQRGIGGGMSLVKAPADLTMLEVINAVEPIPRITTCPLGLGAHGTHLCPLHRRMDEAMATVEKAFRETTLAEVLAEPGRSAPLCEFPTRPKSPGREPR